MKTIVCYGDSNTWGFMPLKDEPELKDARFGRGERWTGRLQAMLGDDWRVEEEGLNGRTSVFDDPLDASRNGLEYADCCFATKTPFDLLIIMLGTNDTKERFASSPYVIASGVGQIAEKTRGKQRAPGGGDPKVLIVAPPPLRRTMPQTWLAGEFNLESVEKSERLAAELEKAARKTGCAFLDAGRFAAISEVDATHLDAANHEKLAAALAKKVKELV
jgi:lysophospholipase L1-like esterase